MLTIKEHSFNTGDAVSCYIKGYEIRDAKIYFNPDRTRDVYICHNIPNFDGDASPNRLGYKYSWVFHVDSRGYTDDVTHIVPFMQNIEKKEYEFSEELNTFFKFNQLENLLLLFHYKFGTFDEYYRYEVSKNQGFITLINERKTMEIKLGRFLKQMALKFNEVASKTPGINKLDITDKLIETIYNKFVSYQQKGNMVEFLEGSKILDGYTRENYLSEDGGTIHNSCMSNRHDFLGIYTENPNQVKLAVIYMSDKIAARCIVWTATDGKQYSDRVYYKYDWLEEFMKEKLRKMGIEPIKEQGIRTVQLEKWNFNQYPYVDSFFYFDTESGTLLSVGPKVNQMRNTNGSLSM